MVSLTVKKSPNWGWVWARGHNQRADQLTIKAWPQVGIILAWGFNLWCRPLALASYQFVKVVICRLTPKGDCSVWWTLVKNFKALVWYYVVCTNARILKLFYFKQSNECFDTATLHCILLCCSRTVANMLANVPLNGNIWHPLKLAVYMYSKLLVTNSEL